MVIANEDKLQHLVNIVRHSFKKGYAFYRKFTKEIVKLNASTLAHSYCKFVKNMIKVLPEESLNSDVWKKAIEKICVFSYVWSVGANIAEDSKSRFDKGLSELFSAESLKSPINNFTLSFK